MHARTERARGRFYRASQKAAFSPRSPSVAAAVFRHLSLSHCLYALPFDGLVGLPLLTPNLVLAFGGNWTAGKVGRFSDEVGPLTQ